MINFTDISVFRVSVLISKHCFSEKVTSVQHFAIIKRSKTVFALFSYIYWSTLTKVDFWTTLKFVEFIYKVVVKRTILLPCMPKFEIEFRFISCGGSWWQLSLTESKRRFESIIFDSKIWEDQASEQWFWKNGYL